MRPGPWAGADVAPDSEGPAHVVAEDAPGRSWMDSLRRDDPRIDGPTVGLFADGIPAGVPRRDDLPAEEGDPGPPEDSQSAQDRTERLLLHGRLTAYQPGGWRKRRFAIAAVALTLLAVFLAVLLRGGGGAWPASVATVQRQAVTACRNPNVKSEPGQVDFACAPGTRQILWVFALMTSGDNPKFADPRTGRLGLEPISPAQGGALAWSLNLHHPYNPFNSVDSLAVAARAINNIVGGATVPGADGKPMVEPGLESVPANCARYTGSAALTVRQDFPGLCARPMTAAGRAALVADIYKRWIVGAPPQDAHDAAVLFQNAADPGNPRVQAILGRLPVGRL